MLIAGCRCSVRGAAIDLLLCKGLACVSAFTSSDQRYSSLVKTYTRDCLHALLRCRRKRDLVGKLWAEASLNPFLLSLLTHQNFAIGRKYRVKDS